MKHGYTDTRWSMGTWVQGKTQVQDETWVKDETQVQDETHGYKIKQEYKMKHRYKRKHRYWGGWEGCCMKWCTVLGQWGLLTICNIYIFEYHSEVVVHRTHQHTALWYTGGMHLVKELWSCISIKVGTWFPAHINMLFYDTQVACTLSRSCGHTCISIKMGTWFTAHINMLFYDTQVACTLSRSCGHASVSRWGHGWVHGKTLWHHAPWGASGNWSCVVTGRWVQISQDCCIPENHAGFWILWLWFMKT